MRDAHVRPSFVIEVTGLTTAWFLYRWGRLAVRDQVSEAFDNAEEVLGAESVIGVAIEDEVQDLVLSSSILLDVVNHYYVYAHFTVALAALLALWATAPAVYRRMRRVLVWATLVGLVVHAVYPLAPPRLVPSMRMVDTLATFGPQVYSEDRFASVTNQFAAMPSFHVGWAALVAGAVVIAYSSPWRWLVLSHPALMTVAVVSTANHYVVDAVAGVAVIGLVAAVDTWLLRRRSPVQPPARPGAASTIDDTRRRAGSPSASRAPTRLVHLET